LIHYRRYPRHYSVKFSLNLPNIDISLDVPHRPRSRYHRATWYRVSQLLHPKIVTLTLSGQISLISTAATAFTLSAAGYDDAAWKICTRFRHWFPRQHYHTLLTGHFYWLPHYTTTAISSTKYISLRFQELLRPIPADWKYQLYRKFLAPILVRTLIGFWYHLLQNAHFSSFYLITIRRLRAYWPASLWRQIRWLFLSPHTTFYET
jgi:hypothetical protein